MLNAVGIDVSKRKSMVAVAQPGGKFVTKPFEVRHTKSGIQELIHFIHGLGGETRIVMEHTGRYHEPMTLWLSSANLFVSAVNPKLIKDFGNNTLRRVKTDKADAKKIARYALDRWADLRQHTSMDTKRIELKTMNRQFNFYMKQKTAYKNNLIALIDQTYPGANSYFESPARPDGSQKWVDFVAEFWHVDCVRSLSLASFTDKYMKWCREHKYNFQPSKPAELMEQAGDLIAVLPKDDMTKMFIQQAIDQLNAISKAVEELRQKMNELAMELPEYPAVIAMNGVGTTLGPQLMAEIGDVSRFAHRGALTAYAGVDPGANESGDKAQKSNKTSKAGSPHLRKTLFQIVDGLLQRSPEDDPVYRFMDKKRSEGKQYYVYMTAGANKFLRIYYGRVKEYLANLPTEE